MSLKFQCQACKTEIITKFLRVGEMAKCRSCGADNLVPESACVVDDSVVMATVRESENTPQAPIAEKGAELTLSCEGQRAWNPVGIFWLGMIFSVLPAGILWVLNFGRLGHPSRKTSSFITAGLFSFVVLVICFLPKVSFSITTPVNLAMCLTYYQSQRTLFRDFMVRGGQKESFSRPIVLSLIFIVIIFTSLFAYGYLDSLRYDKLYREAVSLIERGNLIEAKSRLHKLEEESPDEPAAYYSLAWIHEQNAKYDSALSQLRRYVALQTGDTLALKRVRALEDYLNHKPSIDSAH